MENKNLLDRTVEQSSELGSLGLAALASKGICGPAYSLKGISVDVHKYEKSFSVDFYDMSTTVYEGEKYYQKIKESFNVN